MLFVPWLPSLFLFAAFLLMLLVSLSVPIITSIFIFSLSADFTENIVIASSSATGYVKFGVWGYCASPVDLSAEVVGIGSSMDIPGQCSHPQLGYTFDSTVQAALNAFNVPTNSLSSSITAALVINPIACGLLFLAFTISLFYFFPSRLSMRRTSHLTLAATLLAALLTTAVFVIDVILVSVLRSKVHSESQGSVSGDFGNAVWMSLGAAIAAWGATTVACGGVFAGRRARRQTQKEQAYQGDQGLGEPMSEL